MQDFIKPLLLPLIGSLLLTGCLPATTGSLEDTDKTATIFNTAESSEPSKLSIVFPTQNIPERSVLLQVAENTSEVTQLLAEDSPGSQLTYRLQDGADKDLFALDAATGDLSFKAPPDWENPADADQDNNYRLFWQVTSSSGQTLGQFVIVQVTDLPE